MAVLFSAVITMYNKERWIDRAIASVLAQSEGRFELIVVDDGSTDRGAEVVRGFRDPRVRLLQQRNAGPSAARNAGIRAARGSYLAFLDADDEWLPWHLSSALAGFASFPGAVLVGSGYKEIRPGDAAEAPLFGVSAGELNCRRLESLVEVSSRGEFVFCTISAAIARKARSKTASSSTRRSAWGRTSTSSSASRWRARPW